MSCCQVPSPQPHSPYLMDDSSRCKCEYASERETEREGEEGRNAGGEKRERQIKGWDKWPVWYCQINRNPSYLCAHSFQSISLALFWKHRQHLASIGHKAVPAQPCLFLQRMLIPGAFLYSQIAVLNYRCRERLLFLRGADWWEATKEAIVSRRLQTPVVLQAVNTSLFTAGNGAHLDLSSPC